MPQNNNEQDPNMTSLNSGSDKGVLDYAEDGLDVLDNIQKTKQAVETADKVSKAVSAKGAGGAIAAGGIAGLLVTIILVILLILFVTGIVASILYLPGTIRGKISGFFRKIKVYFAGEDETMSDVDFANVANYIRDRGYDLYGEGFINDEIDFEKNLDDEGRIKKLPETPSGERPHLIELYARMDAYTYRVRNKAYLRQAIGRTDMAGFLNFRIGTWKNNEFVSDKELSGLQQGFFTERIKVDREEETLRVKKGLFNGEYNFSMQGWSGRYGMPLELFMALHQGTSAPDLVRELAEGTRTYRNSNFTDLVTDYEPESNLYYKKPTLDILLLETKAENTVQFLVPTSSVINGQVYVYNGELDFKYGPTNPFAGLNDSSFTVKNAVTPDELYKSFFKLNGQYIRIKPKKPSNTSISYKAPGSRQSSGAPEIVTVDAKEVADGYEYKVKEGNYDLSDKFFESTLVNGMYPVKNMVKEIIDKKTFDKYKHKIVGSTGDVKNQGLFVDHFGLYSAVQHVINAQDGQDGAVSGPLSFNRKLEELMDDTYSGKTYIPMIKESHGHWFRDIYFYMEQGGEYVVEDKDYFLTTGEHWAKYNISEKDGEKLLTPSMKKVEDDWIAYQVRETKNENSLGSPLQMEGDRYAGLTDYMYVFESHTVEARQREEGRRGMTNPRTKKLFTDVEWYKYDGTTARADEIKKDRNKVLSDKDTKSNLKSKVEPNNDLLAAFEILEGSKSLDAQYILKDLKELYVELGYFEKEDLRDPVRRVLRWPLAEYPNPSGWPAASIHQDPEGYGVYVPSKPTLEKIYDEETLANNELIVGKGFEKDTTVVSPVTGRIEEIGTKDVTRIVSGEDGKFERLTYKNVGYITISAIDKKAPKEADPYKPFYDTEYEGVISGKVKHGKLSNDSRYIEGNRITIEGIEIDFPSDSDINSDGSSRYVRQIKARDLKKVQDKKVRENAEKLEQLKIDAPNYITISGSEARVGDYIKEGTIIGKTTDADVKIVMQDADKAFVENVDKYFVLANGSQLQVMEDYNTEVQPGEPNFVEELDVLEYMFEDYPFLQRNAQAFLDMQEKYNLSAIFAAAVTVAEHSGGNATSGLNYEIQKQFGGDHNNIYSIKGGGTPKTVWRDYGEGNSEWLVFEDMYVATDYFAGLITNHSGNYYWQAGDYYVSEIAPSYCNERWGVTVNNVMTTFIEKGMEMRGGSKSSGQIAPLLTTRVLAESTVDNLADMNLNIADLERDFKKRYLLNVSK